MEQYWDTTDHLLANYHISSNQNNKPVNIEGECSAFRCVGVGTDAAVFQSISQPQYAFKVFAADKTEKIKTEAEVYNILGVSPYYSQCFAVRKGYLVLSYEHGITLYDCLLQGVPIPSQVFKDVEDAKAYAILKGLNPRDIHLKNVFLQNGRAKIVDVSEYLKSGDDYRWDHLRKAYHEYYHLIEGKPIPLWLIETVRKWYNQKQPTVIEDFIKDVMRLKFLIK